MGRPADLCMLDRSPTHLMCARRAHLLLPGVCDGGTGARSAMDSLAPVAENADNTLTGRRTRPPGQHAIRCVAHELELTRSGWVGRRCSPRRAARASIPPRCARPLRHRSVRVRRWVACVCRLRPSPRRPIAVPRTCRCGAYDPQAEMIARAHPSTLSEAGAKQLQHLPTVGGRVPMSSCRTLSGGGGPLGEADNHSDRTSPPLYPFAGPASCFVFLGHPASHETTAEGSSGRQTPSPTPLAWCGGGR